MESVKPDSQQRVFSPVQAINTEDTLLFSNDVVCVSFGHAETKAIDIISDGLDIPG
jgi:hypothetical protein